MRTIRFMLALVALSATFAGCALEDEDDDVDEENPPAAEYEPSGPSGLATGGTGPSEPKVTVRRSDFVGSWLEIGQMVQCSKSSDECRWDSSTLTLKDDGAAVLAGIWKPVVGTGSLTGLAGKFRFREADVLVSFESATGHGTRGLPISSMTCSLDRFDQHYLHCTSDDLVLPMTFVR